MEKQPKERKINDFTLRGQKKSQTDEQLEKLSIFGGSKRNDPASSSFRTVGKGWKTARASGKAKRGEDRHGGSVLGVTRRNQRGLSIRAEGERDTKGMGGERSPESNIKKRKKTNPQNNWSQEEFREPCLNSKGELETVGPFRGGQFTL